MGKTEAKAPSTSFPGSLIVLPPWRDRGNKVEMPYPFSVYNKGQEVSEYFSHDQTTGKILREGKGSE